jgi:hypothetical protein
MQRFSAMLSQLDEARDVNSHMTHIEDSVIMQGVDGTRQAINYLRSLRDMLAGDAKAPVNVTVKWDGAPAVFAGIDPSDGNFFVAKKGIFNKNPKVYKSHADIDADTSGDLNEKLKLAYTHMKDLGIKGVIQGDFLYAKKDLRKVDINGEPHITFHPNTIVYAIPEKSQLAKQILGSELGVVWHTEYRGDDFESMSANFGKEIATKLSTSKKVWSVDAVYKDVSGSATMTQKETDAITKILSDAGKKFNTIKKSTFDGIIADNDLNIRVNAFINLKVREGTRIKNTSKFVTELMDYVFEFYQKEIDKLKTERGKEGKRKKRDEVMKFFSTTPKPQIVALFDLYNLIIDAKLMIISKLNKAKSIDTLLLTKDGYRVTGQEGFVAINHVGKNAVKLVDRLEFSKANFSPDVVKGWQR